VAVIHNEGGPTVPATYGTVQALAAALRRAEEAHGKYEKDIGAPDPDWPDWYAAYMLNEQTEPSEATGQGSST
jgi:hypothetical protein